MTGSREPGPQPDESDRSAALIERLLGEPELRRRFLADPAGVLEEHGLPELAGDVGHGRRALLTLELRESRSSLAGVMVAAAAEAVDFAHVAEAAAPGIEHDAGRAIDQLASGPGHPKPRPVPHAAPAKPDLTSGDQSLPPLAQRPQPAGAAPALPQTSAPAAAPTTAGAASSSPATATPSPATPHALRGRLGAAGAEVAAPGSGQPSAPAAGPVHTDPGHAHGAPEHQGATAPGTPVDPLPYPGDSATPQQIAAWMGAQAARAGLPPELPVMAALTESGLRNLNYGDRDSVGFFQMRVGIWNEGPYLGYPDHPQLQVQWFIDHALAVKAQYPGLAQSPSTWGEWVANVEQPAAEYRYRYQLQLGMAQELLHGANLDPPPPAPPVPVGQAALTVALHYLRTPAAHEGFLADPGIDGPGLVRYAYAREGIVLPRDAAQQFDVGTPVARGRLRLGDAVFFAGRDGVIRQVGLYVGSGRFVAAGDGPVRLAPLEDPGAALRYVGARRFTLGAVGDPKSYARPMPTLGS